VTAGRGWCHPGDGRAGRRQLITIRRLIDRRRLQQHTGISGQSAVVQECLVKIEQMAPVSSTVLIQGESGTGKELVAKATHDLSPRRGKPFITVNCAALPETLLESELFGHEKGAFTGAAERRLGRFELADQGTIFPEIGDDAVHLYGCSGPRTDLLPWRHCADPDAGDRHQQEPGGPSTRFVDDSTTA
jgi:transcriptional regulator with PAS, ATPase and Fis domain